MFGVSIFFLVGCNQDTLYFNACSRGESRMVARTVSRGVILCLALWDCVLCSVLCVMCYVLCV